MSLIQRAIERELEAAARAGAKGGAPSAAAGRSSLVVDAVAHDVARQGAAAAERAAAAAASAAAQPPATAPGRPLAAVPVEAGAPAVPREPARPPLASPAAARPAPAAGAASQRIARAVAASPRAAACDVLVVGGGPAGSTIAALLAAEGRDVVLAEKARHPRFHVGEVLLPASVALFEQLGVREQVEALGMPRFGMEFVPPGREAPTRIDFGDAWDASTPRAWQVRRSELDLLLLRNAAARGARTIEGCQVREVDLDDEGAHVEAQLDDGTRRAWRARYVVDASGRDTLLARKLGLRKKDARHDSVALCGHYENAARLPSHEAGHVGVYWFEHGWCWFAPLADGSASVGAVCWPRYLKSRDKPLAEFYADTLALVPQLAERLAHATLVDGRVHATGDYSYAATRCTGERHLLLGDAHASVDPAAWSGVHLAMQGAFAGAQLVATTLDRPEAAAAVRRRFEADAGRRVEDSAWFAQRLTTPALRDMLLHPRPPYREALLSALAGPAPGEAPLRASAGVLRGAYYALSLARLPGSLQAWWRRRGHVRGAGPLVGESVVEAG